MKTGWNNTDRWVLGLSLIVWLLLLFVAYKLSEPKPPYFITILPVGFAGLYLAIRDFERFLYLMVAMVPMSAAVRDIGGGIGAALPAEGMLLISAGGFVLLLLSGKLEIPPGILKHPLTIAIGLQTLWICVTILSSTHLSVSVKFLVARLIYLVVFFIGIGILVYRNGDGVRFFRNYLLGFFPIMIYALITLGSLGFSRKFSPVMAEPFFDDHTLLGVCLSMVLPVTWFLFRQKELVLRIIRPINFGWVIMILVPLTLYMSFSRAAWLGVFVILGFYLLIRLKVKFSWILGVLLLVVAVGWLNQETLLAKMEQNRNVSGEDVVSTMGSVTNLNSDDSNLERINRWACAIRMAEEQPWLGFGPGTYEREYGPFQAIHQRTRISTNNGDRGDAHSEYLGALSEQGIPGMVLLVIVFMTSIWTGLRIVYQDKNPKKVGLAIAILLGLSSYYMHGFVNDFLDLDKAATLFWGMLGVLVAMDVARIDQKTVDSGE